MNWPLAMARLAVVQVRLNQQLSRLKLLAEANDLQSLRFRCMTKHESNLLSCTTYLQTVSHCIRSATSSLEGLREHVAAVIVQTLVMVQWRDRFKPRPALFLLSGTLVG